MLRMMVRMMPMILVTLLSLTLSISNLETQGIVSSETIPKHGMVITINIPGCPHHRTLTDSVSHLPEHICILASGNKIKHSIHFIFLKVLEKYSPFSQYIKKLNMFRMQIAAKSTSPVEVTFSSC